MIIIEGDETTARQIYCSNCLMVVARMTADTQAGRIAAKTAVERHKELYPLVVHRFKTYQPKTETIYKDVILDLVRIN